MSIANGIGLAGFSRSIEQRSEGQWADAEGGRSRPYRNPLRGQITNIAISGFGADADSISVLITLPDGTVITETTTRASSVPVDDAAAATALAAQINARQPLRGHVVASTSTSNLILTFPHTNIVYPVSTSVTAAVATVSTTQAAGGASIPFARFIKAGTSIDGQPEISELASSDEATAVRGITLAHLVAENANSALSSSVDAIPAGSLSPIAYQGKVCMRNNGSVSSAVGGVVHVVRAVTGGDELGEARADAGGTAQVATLTPGAGQNSVEVSVEITMLTGPYAGMTKLLSALADGSMTATEVCDAWRVQLNADPLWSTLLVDSGTATLILTSADIDQTFDVNNVQGTVTIDNATTTPARYTVALDRKRASWDEVTAPGAIGVVLLDM